MGKKRIKLISAIPAAVIGIVCAAVAAPLGAETSKKIIIEKGGESLCVKRK